jgi:pyrroline-5-carboxylate reductase
MTEQHRIGFIGAGNMGSALIYGLIKKGYPSQLLWACDHHPENLQALTQLGINTTEDADFVAANVEILVLAIKPNSIKSTMMELLTLLQTHRPLIVSIAAGITTLQMTMWQGQIACPIIRAMPNTPALLGLGMTGLFATQTVSKTMREAVSRLFASVGQIAWFTNEADMDVVTALSGSGPAYFFYFMECLIQAAISQGLSEEIARKLTFQTAVGAAEMAQKNPNSITLLREKVTSKGGTTEQGINVLKDGNMAELLQTMLAQATKHGKTLSEQYD